MGFVFFLSSVTNRPRCATAHAQSQSLCACAKSARAHASAMADSVEGLSLFPVMKNMKSNTLKAHTKTHTFRGRPTLKDVERFYNKTFRHLLKKI